MLDFNISPFVKQILDYHSSKNLRQFREYNESAFQTAVEILIPPANRVSEMRLINDNRKKFGFGRYNFVDIFVCGENARGFNSNVVLELKLISLKGSLLELDNEVSGTVLIFHPPNA